MAEIALPHNTEAEKTVLGSVLSGAAWSDVSALTRDDFFSDRHRRIFDAMGRLAKVGAAIDLVTVKNELSRTGALEAVGGVQYIAGLVDGLPRISNVAEWCVILKDHAARRRLIAEGHRIAKSAQDGEIDPEAILSAARAAMDSVQNGRGTKLRPLWDGVLGAVEELDRFDSGDFSGRLSTGILRLDRRLRGGLTGGRMYLVCAPPGSGKTTLAQQLVGAASEVGPVLLVSPEMSLESLVTREIVRMSRCEEWDRNPWGLSSPAAKASAQEHHSRAANRILSEKRPVMILDDPSSTMDEIEAAAESMVPSGLALVVIDYAQQVAGTANEKARYLEVGDVAQRSVAMALRLKIPVVVASQVNVVKDGGKSTYVTRESRVLMEKADTTLIIEVNWREDQAGSDSVRSVESAYIVCEKQRSGTTFRLRVEYEPRLYLIRDYEEPKYTNFAGKLLPPVVPED